MTNCCFNFLQSSLRHDTSTSPDKAKAKLSIHFNTKNGADILSHLLWIIIGSVTFVGTFLEGRIWSENKCLDILEISNMFCTFRCLGFVQQHLQDRLFVKKSPEFTGHNWGSQFFLWSCTEPPLAVQFSILIFLLTKKHKYLLKLH